MGIAWLSSVRVLRYAIKFIKRTQPTLLSERLATPKRFTFFFLVYRHFLINLSKLYKTS